VLAPQYPWEKCNLALACEDESPISKRFHNLFGNKNLSLPTNSIITLETGLSSFQAGCGPSLKEEFFPVRL
jgi:hypothetical protein